MKANVVIKAIVLIFVFRTVNVLGQAYAEPISPKSSPSPNIKGTNNVLFLRIYGCEAAGAIANSMGDVTEGLSWRQIEERYGLVDELLAQDKKGCQRSSGQLCSRCVCCNCCCDSGSPAA